MDFIRNYFRNSRIKSYKDSLKIHYWNSLRNFFRPFSRFPQNLRKELVQEVFHGLLVYLLLESLQKFFQIVHKRIFLKESKVSQVLTSLFFSIDPDYQIDKKLFQTVILFSQKIFRWFLQEYRHFFTKSPRDILRNFSRDAIENTHRNISSNHFKDSSRESSQNPSRDACIITLVDSSKNCFQKIPVAFLRILSQKLLQGFLQCFFMDSDISANIQQFLASAKSQDISEDIFRVLPGTLLKVFYRNSIIFHERFS